MTKSLRTLVRWWREEEGQDLVEYALLVLFVILMTVAVWDAIVAAMGLAYQGYDASLWNLFWQAPGG